MARDTERIRNYLDSSEDETLINPTERENTMNDFDDGRFQGRTEASIEGVARSLDELRAEMRILTRPDGLCSRHAAMIRDMQRQIDDQRTGLKWAWAAVVAAVGFAITAVVALFGCKS